MGQDRHDRRPTCRTSPLRGKPIGAAIDVGFPEGHNGTVRKPYFNAGVLLLDLAAVRRTLQALQGAAREYTTSRFRDQDLLNAYFEANWAEVSLKWNAQGIATYAELPTEARQKIDMGLLKNPYIVHFTGPVNPTLEVVLNPYVQPYTAKPWGYAGAPGHPHGEEWWNVVEQTAWKGWRASEEYRMLCASEKERAIRDICLHEWGSVVYDICKDRNEVILGEAETKASTNRSIIRCTTAGAKPTVKS